MLNPKQERFCSEYVTCGNAAAAYRQAYGTTSDGTARANASKLLRNQKIQTRIAELQSEVASAAVCTAQEIQERLTSIARREQTDTVYLPNGTCAQRPTAVRDSIRALELLAKIHGMFITKTEVDMHGITPVVILNDI